MSIVALELFFNFHHIHNASLINYTSILSLFSFLFFFSAEELGIKELLPAYLDPNLAPNDLLTGVSFAVGATGYDPMTAKVVVNKRLALVDYAC